jgi:hypothetical protein
MTEYNKDSEFPDWYTIDGEGLASLCYFLDKEFGSETVKITVIRENEFRYRCPKCKILIVALTQEKLDAAIKRHKCRGKVNNGKD